MPGKARHFSAFVEEGFAVSALAFGGVALVGANLNFVESAVIAVFAMMCAVVYAASNVFVSFIHGLNTSNSFCIYF